MRKTVSLLVTLLLLCSFSTISFAKNAQGKATKEAKSNIEIIKGKIVSIDTANNTIVIRDRKSGTEKTFSVDLKTISSLKIGDEVKVTFKSGTDIAESVKKIANKKHKK